MDQWWVDTEGEGLVLRGGAGPGPVTLHRLSRVAQGSPIFHSSFKGELGIALESLQGKIDLI